MWYRRSFVVDTSDMVWRSVRSVCRTRCIRNSGLTKTFRCFWGYGTRILVSKTELVLLLIVTYRTKVSCPFRRRRNERKKYEDIQTFRSIQRESYAKKGRQARRKAAAPAWPEVQVLVNGHHSEHNFHFFISTRQEYSVASLTPPFLRTYSTWIFNPILNTSISLYLLDWNILLHPWHLNFFVSTGQEYSIASSTPPFLHTYSTRIFNRILDTSITSYLLDRSILLHPRQLHFFVSTLPKYSFASSTPPFLRTYSTRIFYRVLNTSISTYLLDQNIFSYPWHINFNVSTRPEYSIASSTTPFLRIYSTRIFHRILDTSISTYQLDQNIRLHPWHLNFYVSSVPKYSFASWMQLEVCFFVSTKMMMNNQNSANEQLKHLNYHAAFYC